MWPNKGFEETEPNYLVWSGPTSNDPYSSRNVFSMNSNVNKKNDPVTIPLDNGFFSMENTTHNIMTNESLGYFEAANNYMQSANDMDESLWELLNDIPVTTSSTTNIVQSDTNRDTIETPVPVAAPKAQTDKNHVDEKKKRAEVLKKEKVLRNREAVRRCRRRKENRLHTLENQVSQLERENNILKGFVEVKGLSGEFLTFSEESKKKSNHNGSDTSVNEPQHPLNHNPPESASSTLREQRLALLQRMVRSLNSGGVDDLLSQATEIWHEDFVLVQGFSGEEIRGLEEVKQWWMKNGDVVPDLLITSWEMEPRTLSAEKVRVSWSLKGTFAHPESLLCPMPKDDGSIGSALIKVMLPAMRNTQLSISGFSYFIFRGVKLEQVVHSYDYSMVLAQILGMKCDAVVDEVETMFAKLGIDQPK